MKIIKRIGIILGKTMITIIAILALAYGLLQLPYTQKKLTTFISQKISTSIGLQVSVSHVSVYLWNSISLDSLSISNKNNDTIALIPKLFVQLASINRDSLHLQIKNIKIYNANIQLRKDSLGIWNFEDFLKKNSNKKDSSAWTIGINNIEIFKSNFKLQNLVDKQNQKFGINYNDLNINQLHLQAYNFLQKNNSFSCSINRLSCKEKSGFNLLYFETDATITDTSIVCKDVMIFTPDSKVYANAIQFNYKNFEDFNDFVSKVKFVGEFEHSVLSLKDISFFAPSLQNNPYTFSVSGNISGKVSNIKGKKIHIGYGKSSRFIGNIEISGLPDINQSFLHINAVKLETNKHDISQTRIPPFSEDTYLTIPSFLDKINTISYSGNFTGFINDFVAYGTMVTDVGTIYSDILISQSTDKTKYNYSGDLTCIDLNLNKFPINEDLFGIMNSKIKINGIFQTNSIVTANIQGVISNIDFNNYKYSNITVDGVLSNQKFDGNIAIQDPNIELQFHGLFDYSTEIPNFKFNADIKQAKLYKLGLYTEDSLASLSFSSNVDFMGIKLDNLKGFIFIPHASYTGKYGTYETNNMHIDIDNINQTRNVTINSDLFDLSINGKGNYKELPGYMYDFLKTHISVLPNIKTTIKKTYAPSFNVSLRIKKIDSLLKVIYPDIQISQGSYINTIYSEDSKLFIIDAKIPDLTIKQNHIQNFEIKSEGNADALNVFCEFDYDKFKDIQSLWQVKKDSLFISSHWENNENKIYKGSIYGKGKFLHSEFAYFPGIDLKIEPGRIYVADSLWNIYASQIIIDSTNITIPYGSFGKNNQLIKLNGTISENPKYSMQAEFFNYNLENFNYIIDNKYVILEGIIQGKIEVSDFYHDQLIFANISVPEFTFNKHKVGKLSAVSQWIPLQKAISMNISLQQGNVYTLRAIGTFVPSTQKIDYNLSLKDLKLSNFKEIFESTISNLNGYVDGEISATGELTNPQFSGNLDIKRGKFLVNYTQTPYNFKGEVRSQGSKFIFNEIPITDSLSNVSLASGYIDLKNILNPHFLIELETEKLLVLNTKEIHNEMFYGKAFYQGNAKIEGDFTYTNISAVGKTLENSEFNIPLSYSELSTNQDFLRFTDTVQSKKPKVQNNSSYLGTEIDINLTVTPVVLTQIIFDKKVGDIIKVRGSGNIQMLMNRQGKFTMYGDYSIDEGDYLFTLKNLINKKFIIEKGGSITWNGDPLEAQIDVLAKYELKASPQSIMDTNSSVDYSRRIPVTCNILLEKNLMNPEISYDIAVPNSASQVQEVLNTYNTDEKNMQFLSLLLMNTFRPKYENQSINSSASFEVLSNQLNNLLSQMGSAVDVGVNYRPGNAYNANEFELALSTQLLNNRILVNVNGYSEFGNTSAAVQTRNQTNEIAGDVSVEVKINKQGTFKAKGFSRSNNDPLAENQGNTQGISLFFTKEFNSLKELLSKKH